MVRSPNVRVGVLVGGRVEQRAAPPRRAARRRSSGAPSEGEQPGVLGDQLPLARPGRQREVEAVADQQQRRAGVDRVACGSRRSGGPGGGRSALRVEGGVEDVARRARRPPGRCGPGRPRRAPTAGRRAERDRAARLDGVAAEHRGEGVAEPGRGAAHVGGEVAGPSGRRAARRRGRAAPPGRSRGSRRRGPSVSRTAATSRATSSGWMERWANRERDAFSRSAAEFHSRSSASACSLVTWSELEQALLLAAAGRAAAATRRSRRSRRRTASSGTETEMPRSLLDLPVLLDQDLEDLAVDAVVAAVQGDDPDARRASGRSGRRGPRAGRGGWGSRPGRSGRRRRSGAGG